MKTTVIVFQIEMSALAWIMSTFRYMTKLETTTPVLKLNRVLVRQSGAEKEIASANSFQILIKG